MKALVVYESMFGNTRTVAEAIGHGLSRSLEVTVIRASEADSSVLNGKSFVVVGGPTHAWGMPRPSTRRGGPDYATKGGRFLGLGSVPQRRPEYGSGSGRWAAPK